MKSIYKKLSVGVLAAALLVGGSEVLQGGQAFADFKVLDKDEDKLEEYLKEAEAKEPGFVGYNNKSDRRQVARKMHKRGLSVEEAINENDFKAERRYYDGWELDDDIDYILRRIKSSGKCDVKVGNLNFRIKR